MLPFVHLLGCNVPTYGLCLVCGALLAGLTALVLGRRSRVKREDIIFCGMYAALGALVGAKAGFLLVHAGELAAQLRAGAGWQDMLRAATGSGFLSFGALAGGLGGFLLYCREFGVERDALACCLLPAAPLGLACCRLGCFAAGCCYGRPWAGKLSVINQVSPLGVNGVPLFPVQLLSAGWDLLLFAAMLAWPRLRYPAPAGRLTGFFLALYSLGRFGLEFLRGDHPHDLWLGLSGAQWFCLPLLAFGLLLCFKARAAARPVKAFYGDNFQ